MVVLLIASFSSVVGMERFGRAHGAFAGHFCRCLPRVRRFGAVMRVVWVLFRLSRAVAKGTISRSMVNFGWHFVILPKLNFLTAILSLDECEIGEE